MKPTPNEELEGRISIDPDKEVNLGNGRVFYCDPADPPGLEVNTGNITFRVQHSN